MKPKISVIIPVYNAAPYLRRTLNSACAQTLGDLEFLCIDDGSTDRSPAILAEYAAREPRIRLITLEKNRGISRAMNHALDAAQGEALGILDADDVIGRNFYAELWKGYENGDCDIVKGRQKFRGIDGKWSERATNAAIKIDPRAFNTEWTSAIYRTDFIRRHGLRLDTRLAIGQDVLFLHQLIGYEPRIRFSDAPIYYYLRNDASITSTAPLLEHLASRLRLRRILKEYLPAYPAHIQRLMFEMSLHALYTELALYKDFDWARLMPEIKKLLADDAFYSPQSEFPLLKEALLAEDSVSLRRALKLCTDSARVAMVRQKMGYPC